MCLAIPAQVSLLLDDEHLAMVDIMGVRRKVSIDLLIDDPPVPGDWVLIHVGFAMSKISAKQAEDQLQALAILGEETAALEEVDGYADGMVDPGTDDSERSDLRTRAGGE